MSPIEASAVRAFQNSSHVDSSWSDEPIHWFGPGAIEWRGEKIVRLEEQYRKSAVLIGTANVGSNDEISPWGSGFLVDVDTESRGGKYLVTAMHVVADMLDAPFDVRFNKRDGGAQNHHIDEPHWVTHPVDDTVDVAVHEIEVPEWADCQLIPRVPIILEDRRFMSKDIGVGNRTYTVGLWKFLHGDRRNQPFVYTGHIGLVPEDQRVPVEPWLRSHKGNKVLVEAYLVEGQPLDGASGSPVFVRRTLGPHYLTQKLKSYTEGSIWLLGLHSDAWVARPGIDYEPAPGGGGGVVPRAVNIVVPSMKINEVLDHPELKKRREDTKAKEEQAAMPVKTGAASQDDEAVIRRRDAALKRALETPPQPKKSGGGSA
jgi:hypothetical protein